MKRGLTFALFAIFGFAYASADCTCPKTSQREVFEASDLVAKVRFHDAQPDPNNNKYFIFNTTVVKQFKANNSTTPANGTVLAAMTIVDCNPMLQYLMFGEDYLIGVKKINDNYQFVSCNGFPQHASGRPILAQPWDLVTNRTTSSLQTGKFDKV